MSRDSRRDPPEAGSLAFTFVALVLVFTGLGYLADRWLHSGPWVMVAGVFVGAGLGFVYLVFILFSGSSGSRGRKGKDEVGKDRDAAQGNGRID
ncbi:MAG: hypothetical protein A2133_04160 [Actinobacteria bacterium RBG_16_64_13]|nr:MAG: hypothetical protein A2133_04160 [Actinobacteria bacterium RBG_16_64_13]